MGQYKHNAIIVTGDLYSIEVAHSKAKEIFDNLPAYRDLEKTSIVSSIVKGFMNSNYSFFIAPDGSKEGRQISEECDKARDDFFYFCEFNGTNDHDFFIDYVEVEFGGDLYTSNIVREIL